MRRIHAVELEDLPWFPELLRDAGVAFLRFVSEHLGHAKNIQPIVERALAQSGETEILDLCSGGGGPIIAIARRLHEQGRALEVTLSDLYPSKSGRELVDRPGHEQLSYEPRPCDATAIPAGRAGLRTLFNAFHHLRPELAVRVLASAVEGRRAIAVVEILQRRVLTLVLMLGVPLLALLVVPLLRPFRPSWLLFTYVLPIIPLFVWWDGVVSTLRVYTREELLELAARADPEETFEWRVSEVPLWPVPVPGIALVGVPRVPHV